MFKHDLIHLPSLEQINSPSGRRYKTPEGLLYPSVTTVLGATLDHTALDLWKERVGEEEAAHIAQVASTRGTRVHELCEDFVLNKPLRKAMPITVMMYKQIEKVLKENMNNVRMSEGRLYSNKLKVAGSVDLLADWQGKPSTIDFKTSIRNKKEEWIRGYFLQTAMYAYMAWERTGLMFNNIVIIIAVEEESKAQVFNGKATDWIDEAFMLCKAYHLEDINERFKRE